MHEKYEAVIGLEVHAQLSTKTKIFCGCSTTYGGEANTNVCPVCLGHPGVLPVLNKKVVEFAALTGLATNCEINTRSVFARKNYFYPDLPKGYQTSQFDLPICINGTIHIKLDDGTEKDIRLMRIHMEEDAGKSIHDKGKETHVDVNRCGVPLIEMVSEPDLSSAQEAYAYLTELKKIVTYLGVCDGNMEEGSLRCDANISIRPKGETKLGTRTEVKNMNSFRNVERAIEFEIKRQIELVEDGEKVIQQTLLWNADINEAFPMRGKEESHDYRYFPCPDLVPVEIDNEWMESIKSQMPELPQAKKQKYMEEYKLPEYDADILTLERNTAEYFEAIINETDDYKSASNWVMGEIMKITKEEKIDIADFPVSPANVGRLINLINKKTISGKIAKDIFPDMMTTGKDPETIVKEKNLIQITDTSAIEPFVEEVIAENPNEVKQFLEGKEKIIGFLVGKVMQKSRGKANPQMVNQLLKDKMNK